MKTTLPLCAGLLLMVSASAWGVATIGLSNYEAEMPILLGGSGPSGSLAPVQGSFVQLLANGVPVLAESSGSSILALTEPGYFYAGVATIPGVADGASVELTLRAWQNAASYEAATVRGAVTWSQAAGSWNPKAVPPAPITGPALTLKQPLTITSSTPPIVNNAQATLALNNYDCAMPIRMGTASQPGDLAPIQGTWVELLADGIPVPVTAQQASTFALSEPGYFYGGVVAIPGLAAGTSTELTLRAWQNATSFESATIRGSVTWSQATGSWTPNAQPPAPMNGPSLAMPHPLYLGVPSGPALASFGDFNQDGASDLLFQHKDGTLAVWFLKNGQFSGAQYLQPQQVAKDWAVAGLGDLNQDKQQDLLFQHSSGLMAVWHMNKTDMADAKLLTPSSSGGNWNLKSTSDFNEDGKADLLFQHTDGTLAAWFMNGDTMKSAQLLSPAHPGDPRWEVVGMADFNNDGSKDLLFQHQKDGDLAVWLMDGTTLLSAHLLNPPNPGHPNWKVVALADYNQDGKADLILQNRGSLAVWYMDGINLKGGNYLTATPIDPDWQVVGPR